MDYVVIMAGGTGKRLWPLSREKRPKQVLKLIEGQTLLRRCFDRLTPMFDSRNILVLTNAGYADIVRENIPEVPFGNVIAEPVVRDTAGAIGLAATILTKTDPDATMAVVTADQLIEPDEIFQSVMSDAMTFVNKNHDALITFGIKPTFPSTQLGYIELDKTEEITGSENAIYPLDSFCEKPNKQTAEKFLESGKHLWNSGMFVWKAKCILDNLEKFLPSATTPLKKIHDGWDSPDQEEILVEWFRKMPKISIDFAVMEKADNVYATMLNCKWFDMGSFAALADIITSDEKGNIVVAGQSELMDSDNNIIVTEEDDHLIATIGLKDMIVAHTPDATLVCPMDQAHKLKELLETVKDHGKSKFL